MLRQPEKYLFPTVPCSERHGSGEVRQYARTSDLWLMEPCSGEPQANAKVQIEIVKCSACGGTGKGRVPDRPKILQDGQVIGTSFGVPRIEPSFLVEPRPDDFTPIVRDGEIAFEAHSSLCPGDLEAVFGFSWSKNRTEPMGAEDAPQRNT